MKKATASTNLEIWVDCPHCDNYQNVFEEIRERLGDDLRAENVDEEITCDDEDCGKTFLVTEIEY